MADRSPTTDSTGPYPEGAGPLLKRILPRSLLGRAMMIIVTPVVLVQVIAAYIFFERHYDTTTRRLVHGLAGEIAMTINLMEHRRIGLSRQEVFRVAESNIWFELAYEAGEALPTNAPSPRDTILDRRLRGALDRHLSYPYAVDTWSRPDTIRIWVAMPDGRLTVTLPRKRLFTLTTYLLIFWTVGTGVLLVAVAMIFMRNQVRPIRRLAVAAERFGKGLDIPQFRPQGAREVRQAAAAFIQMRRRIERQIQQRTDMLSGVSHDLRTPLTRMKLEIAMLGDTPEARALHDDIAEMERMVDGYLAFARGEGAETPRTVPLHDLVEDAVSRAGVPTGAITTDVPTDVNLTVRREALRRALSNLIANAARAARSRVEVTARVRAGHAEVRIDDDGPGIPPEQREDVFRPFFRLDQSRNPETGGTGLGLTIARDIIRGHGGELHLTGAPVGGLRAQALLPLTPPSD